MKACIVQHLSPLLLLVACNDLPDTALFSPTVADETGGSPVDAGGKGGSSSGGSASGSSGTDAIAGGPASGGATTDPPEPSSDGGSPEVDAGGAGGAGTDPAGAAVCGNGRLDVGEQCDDGGHEGKDGCSSDCQVVCADFGSNVVSSDEHHCYAGYDEATFEEAKSDCLERGAHLVTIASEVENELVSGFVNNSKFIGAYEDVELMSNGEGTYEWVTGEPFAYENWDGEQPDRASERCSPFSNKSRCYEHCALIQGDGTWADQRCDLVDGYVCEWEPAGS
jgi:cysteine-rich repeat protein